MKMVHGTKPLEGIDALCSVGHERQEGEKFGRMFQLPPLSTMPSALKALGKKGGPLDSQGNSDRASTVGTGDVFFGQFIDHDITLDIVTSLGATADINSFNNARTPSLDLDSIFGMGPEAQPYLYHNEGEFRGVKLLTGADSGTDDTPATELQKNDLARAINGRAVIGDPRNDENRIISQMHLAMINFYNRVVDKLHEKYEGAELFEEARRLATWHYQWVIVHDFLVKMCGEALVKDILGNGRQCYQATFGDAFIPVEFSVAAYRFGHLMVPQKIQIQKNENALEIFGTFLGRGFQPLSTEKAIVDWLELIESDAGRQVQMAEKMNTKMAPDLLALPFFNPDKEEVSLAVRNLLRGQTFLLPSGENIARAMGRSDTEIKAVVDNAVSVAGSEIDLSAGLPLWFYIMNEAEIIGRESASGSFDRGEGLGPVGGRIVAETLIGLIELDPRSYMAVNRNWEPSDDLNVSTLIEMLTF